MRKKCGSVECAVQFSTKFSGLSETVPDILTNYVYVVKQARVQAYTQQTQGTNTEYLDLLNAELQAGIPAVQLQLFCEVRSTQRKTTVAWKQNPCRNSVVFSAAARSRQNATDRTERGSDTLVLRTRSYNLFRTQSHSNGNKHPQKGSKWLVS